MKYILITALLLPILSGAAEKVLFSESFEDYIPGREYKLGKGWGKHGTTIQSIANETSTDGEKSLMFEIAPGPMHGFSLSMPEATGKGAVLEYHFLIDGVGSFGWEFRLKGKVQLGISIGQRGLVAYSAHKKVKLEKGAGRLGKIDQNVWYAVKIELPASGSGSEYLTLTLTNLKTKETKTGKLGWNAPLKGLSLLFNPPTTQTSYRVFVDAIKYSSID